MELRRIRYFLSVAEELHFGRAAERLHMAQPPLSEQIRKLEEELDVKLFTRTSRSVLLTEAGHAFLSGARQAVEALERSALAARQVHRGESGHVALGFVSSTSNTVLPKVLRALRVQLPNVEVTVRKYSSASALGESLVNGEQDVGITRPVADERLKSRPFLHDSIKVALSDDHPRAGQSSLTLEMLANEFFILFPSGQGNSVTSITESVCRRAGFRPQVAHYVDDVYAMLGLVAAGAGIALVPCSLEQLKLSGIRFVELQACEERFDLALTHRRDNASPVLSRVLKVIQEAVE